MQPQLEPNYADITIAAGTGVEIFLNNERKGTGSWSGRLETGQYKIKAQRASHRPVEQLLVVLPDMQEKNIRIEPLKPIVGNLTVTTTPAQAAIYLDGKHVGETPRLLRDVLIGSHSLTIKKEGYADVNATVEVAEGEMKQASYSLSQRCTVTVDVNDTRMGSVSGGGSYTIGEKIQLRASAHYGYEFVEWSDGNKDKSRTVEVNNDKSYRAIFQKYEIYAVDRSKLYARAYGEVLYVRVSGGDDWKIVGQSTNVYKAEKINSTTVKVTVNKNPYAKERKDYFYIKHSRQSFKIEIVQNAKTKRVYESRYKNNILQPYYGEHGDFNVNWLKFGMGFGSRMTFDFTAFAFRYKMVEFDLCNLSMVKGLVDDYFMGHYAPQIKMHFPFNEGWTFYVGAAPLISFNDELVNYWFKIETGFRVDFSDFASSDLFIRYDGGVTVGATFSFNSAY